MTNQSEARRLFAGIMDSEREISLPEATLLFAKEIEYPNLDIHNYLNKINSMTDEIKGRTRGNTDPFFLVSEINKYLFAEQGFRGNEKDYYEPRNSFLNDVLDRKTGIPITLSVLYIEIGNRIGLPISGVGFPGHFIVKYSGREGEILIDPFNSGRILSEKSCRDILDMMYGGRIQFQREFLESATRKQILTRMLHNLKNIYLSSKDYIKAISVVDMVLLIDSRAVNELRDRGLIYYKLECFARALSDLEQYLRIVPQADDREAIKNFIIVIKSFVGRVN